MGKRKLAQNKTLYLQEFRQEKIKKLPK